MDKIKFLVDEMLASVTRWLRILGFDALYAQDLENSKETDLDILMLTHCKKTDRILLTKDVTLAKRAKDKDLRVILLNSDDVGENLKQIFDKLNLTVKRESVGRRCSVCNSPLERIEKEKVKRDVPPKVVERQEKFWRCTNPSCQHVFWKGSHWDRISDMIALLKDKKDK